MNIIPISSSLKIRNRESRKINFPLKNVQYSLAYNSSNMSSRANNITKLKDFPTKLSNEMNQDSEYKAIISLLNNIGNNANSHDLFKKIKKYIIDLLATMKIRPKSTKSSLRKNIFNKVGSDMKSIEKSFNHIMNL